MKEVILELMDIFDIQIESTDVSPAGNVRVYFEGEFAWASVTYEPTTSEMISATVESKDRKFYYQLSDDDYEIDLDATKLEVYDDFIEKAKAIWNNLPFDERIIMVFDLEDDVKEELIRSAEQRGVSVDEFIEQALKELIVEYKDKNEPTN